MKLALLLLFLSNLIFSQTNCPPDTTGYQVIKDMIICFTKLSVEVSYHPECSCYYYKYTVYSPPENKGDISGLSHWFKSAKIYQIIDPDLPYNPLCDITYGITRELKLKEKRNLIPASIIECPQGWKGNSISSIAINCSENCLKPGQTLKYTIVSHFPPGERKFKIEYNYMELQDFWDSQFAPPPEDWPEEMEAPWPGYTPIEEANPPVFTNYDFEINSIGPVDPEELDLYNGGGQKPDDVNLFLRYGSPKESKTELPSGTDKFEIFIYYGKTIKPETFKATLNDVDIKNLFTPVPGGGDYVKINLQNGRNVLIFSVDGLNEKGQTANDKDRLVLIVK